MSQSQSQSQVSQSAAAPVGSKRKQDGSGETSESKKTRTAASRMSELVIGTHNGTFHCDEALACWMLHQTDKYRGAKIVRSRDKATLDKCDIVVDVGGVFDVDALRFDHHQRSFNETFDDEHTVTKLSSAGLVYKYFGREVVGNVAGTKLDAEQLELVYQKLYDDLIESVDAVDNGVDLLPDGVKPAYKVSTTLGARVHRLNPMWNEKSDDDVLYQRFLKAVAITGEEFTSILQRMTLGWLPARDVVRRTIEKRHSVHPSGQILHFEEFTSWKSHLYSLEEEMKVEPQILYVIYADSAGKYRVQCVSESSTSFKNRKSLPAAWRGVRDEELSKLSGIPGCIFVHAAGFIGGNETYEGAFAMAKFALENTE